MTYHRNVFFDIKPLLEMLRESYDWFVTNFDRMQAEKAGSVHRKPIRELALRIVKRLS
jgi:hypothetical protein